jgi:hypothetical protein
VAPCDHSTRATAHAAVLSSKLFFSPGTVRET